MLRLCKIVCALILSGSAFFYSGCMEKRIEEGVVVQGIEVGGMTLSEAEKAVGNRIAEELPPLTVHTPTGDYVYRYPQLSFSSDAKSVLKGAKAGETLFVHVTRTWADLEEEAERICKENAREGKNAEVFLTDETLTYTKEERARACNYARLTQDLTSALASGAEEVTLNVEERNADVSEEKLREYTQKLSSFTTYFDKNNVPRVENILLSAARCAGTVLQAGEEFSFNGRVGLRTPENGFQIATVIQNGQFTDGIGGGVCQTSTTLFNAALLAGMKITESRAHSLSIGYVKPSLDAMVSEYSDLKFVNTREFPVYILMRVEEEGIGFEFYGKPDGTVYQTESVMLMTMDPPPPQIVEGTEEKEIRAEKAGLASESYLLKYDEKGNLLSRTLIRKDSYATVQGIYQILPE